MAFSLDDSIEKYFPRGYMHCSRCGRYFHHVIIYCTNCGYTIHREKKMSWRNFLARTARFGSGPINTVRVLITGLLFGTPLPENEDVMNEADAIYHKNEHNKGSYNYGGITRNYSGWKEKPDYDYCGNCGIKLPKGKRYWCKPCYEDIKKDRRYV